MTAPEVVAAAVAGDRDAWAQIWRDNHATIIGQVRRRVRDPHLADDLTAEVFARALASIGRYRDVGRPIGAWLSTIARNIVADHWKAGARRDLLGDGPDRADSDPHVDPARRAELAAWSAALSEAISRLSEPQQAIVDARYLRGLSIAETCAETHLATGAVKARQFRAVRQLAADPALQEWRTAC